MSGSGWEALYRKKLLLRGERLKSRVIALGFFDGVHLGHGALLERTYALAKEYGVPGAALTFDIHPDELVRQEPILLLNTRQEREYLVKTLYGMDELLTLTFDRQRMEQPWQDFVEKTLLKEYGAVHLVCGYDFRFGARGEGNGLLLKEYCTQRGIGCDCIPQVSMGGEAVSSTRIRRRIQEGAMEEAVALLGHPHLIRGAVVEGRKLGRTIGIPTANVDPGENRLLPCCGVYAAMACFEGQCHPAVVNIGNRPTVGGHHITIEPWILDFEGDLYGKDLSLELYRFLRPEKKFTDLDELRQEIHHNAEQTRQLFQEFSSAE